MNRPLTRRTVTTSMLAGAAALGATGLAHGTPAHTTAGTASAASGAVEPTIVLAHGAFTDASSWSAVIERLLKKGHRVIAPPIPLRGVASDAAYLRSVMDSVEGPVVLVGHSYGGSVISRAAVGSAQVKALVYIAAFVPDVGESAAELSDKFPGSSLASTTVTQKYPLAGGGQGDELLIRQDAFHRQFAAGVPRTTADTMAVGQRPITVAALQEPATAAAWKKLPTWYLIATEDRNIPPKAQRWMAARAKAHVHAVDAPHAVSVSDPRAVTDVIRHAVRSVRSGH
ncbi:alpha/beta fold hydrolase [Streptomyces daghestanicus]|uniref:Alpha/beta hydrolase n=1 Tax=Streptomyces daghestanicus TaxID=66885 RepID=A0ABQ3Q845_9ACTN|nr:alpha/beta hydrolase [Streptomyces daghestanicus]GGU66824.1 alpha/beta hydrolase [Streptomyces daghestanicus]GHI33432.1 alpha/beta hydrolase [Streptomyces daghestanicus]